MPMTGRDLEGHTSQLRTPIPQDWWTFYMQPKWKSVAPDSPSSEHMLQDSKDPWANFEQPWASLQFHMAHCWRDQSRVFNLYVLKYPYFSIHVWKIALLGIALWVDWQLFTFRAWNIHNFLPSWFGVFWWKIQHSSDSSAFLYETAFSPIDFSICLYFLFLTFSLWHAMGKFSGYVFGILKPLGCQLLSPRFANFPAMTFFCDNLSILL